MPKDAFWVHKIPRKVRTASFYGLLGIAGRPIRLIRRKAIIMAATATYPYSSSITQTGSGPHGRPRVRKCHWTYTGMMLTLQRMISSVEGAVRNGSSQRRYQGNTAGAHKREAAIGHANMAGDHSDDELLNHAAVASPTNTASPANKGGDAT